MTNSKAGVGWIVVAPAGPRRAARPAAAFAALLLLAAPVAAQPKHKIESADTRAVTATITYELRTANFAVSKWMVFLPEPPELPSQTKVKTTAAPAGKVVAEKSALARNVRYVEVPVANPKPVAG